MKSLANIKKTTAKCQLEKTDMPYIKYDVYKRVGAVNFLFIF